jgi:hypothetical protein
VAQFVTHVLRDRLEQGSASAARHSRGGNGFARRIDVLKDAAAIYGSRGMNSVALHYTKFLSSPNGRTGTVSMNQERDTSWFPRLFHP